MKNKRFLPLICMILLPLLSFSDASSAYAAAPQAAFLPTAIHSAAPETSSPCFLADGCNLLQKDGILHTTPNILGISVAAAVYEPGTVEESYWDEVLREIKSGSQKTITIKSDNLRHLPAIIIRELKGKDITLEITRDSQKIYIHGSTIQSIPANKVFYSWEDLFARYEGTKPTKPASPSKPASKPDSSSDPQSEVSTLLPDEEEASSTPAQSMPEQTASSSSETSSEPESSRPASAPEVSSESEETITVEETPEKPHRPKPAKPRRSIVPLVIAGIVILFALGAGWLAIRAYNRSMAEDEDDEDEEYETQEESKFSHRR